MVAVDYDGFYAESAEHTVAITPRELSAPEFYQDVLSKPYDGKTDPNPRAIEALYYFYGSGSAAQTKFTLTLGNDYEVNSLQYNSPDVKDAKELEYDITLKNENYKAADRSVRLTGSVAASISTGNVSPEKEGMLTIANDQAATYTIDFKSLLTKLDAPKRYGTIACNELSLAVNVPGYYDSSNGASITADGVLTLPIQKYTGAAGLVGTVTFDVTTQNYIIGMGQLTLNVNAVNKKTPVLDGNITLSKNTLTYGETLDSIRISGTMKVDGTEVEGTFTWQDPDQKPNAGERDVVWKFTPTDDNYLEVTGKMTINVSKAKLSGAPGYTTIKEAGKTLADAALTPNAGCTRAQSMALLFRALGQPTDGRATFSDVSADSYCAGAVAWAVENGLTSGVGNGKFGPNQSCTRVQIVTFLYRAYQLK